MMQMMSRVSGKSAVQLIRHALSRREYMEKNFVCQLKFLNSIGIGNNIYNIIEVIGEFSPL